MQPIMQGYSAATSYGNHIPHVESGQHEAMVFTVWLNPQIILITTHYM